MLIASDCHRLRKMPETANQQTTRPKGLINYYSYQNVVLIMVTNLFASDNWFDDKVELLEVDIT